MMKTKDLLFMLLTLGCFSYILYVTKDHPIALLIVWGVLTALIGNRGLRDET